MRRDNQIAFFRSLIFDYIFSFFFSALLNLCPLFLSFSPFAPALSSFSPLKRFPPLPFETLPKEDPKEERRFLPQKGGRAPPACALTVRPRHGRGARPPF